MAAGQQASAAKQESKRSKALTIAVVLIVVIAIAGVAIGYLYSQGGQTQIYNVSYQNGDFQIVPPEGGSTSDCTKSEQLVVPPFSGPGGANSILAISIINLRSSPIQTVDLQALSGGLSFCSASACAGSEIALSPKDAITNYFCSGPLNFDVDANGAVIGASYLIQVTLTYQDGNTSSLVTRVTATPPS